MRLTTQRGPAPSALTLLVSLGMAAGFGAVVYLVSSSLPFLASSAVSDVHFGALNACALAALKPPRTGFAVSSDGTALVAFSGAETVRCDALADGGANSERVGLDGVTAAAFDFDGGLWLAREGLYRASADGGVQVFAQVAPAALAGTPHGAVALEASGRLVAVQPDGNVGGVAQLPKPVQGAVNLLVSADGERVALVVSGGVFVWSAEALKPLRAEAPCPVEAAWWLPEGHRLLLSCGADADFALEWDVDTGAQSAAPQRKRSRSALVPEAKLYVQACEQLACTAAPP